jgi:hypothetical protein
MNPAEPQAVRRGFEWLLSFLEPADWTQRRNSIEARLVAVARPHAAPVGSKEFQSVSIVDDRIGWYLYLAEAYLNRPLSYEPIQGARVLPIFGQLGSHVALLERLKGIREKCRELTNPERRNPDPGLFEILTALMYARNGWPQVEFIPRSRKEKRPDIRVSDGKAEWHVECKRLVGCSAYSTRERRKWLTMWQPLVRFLHEERLPIVLEIGFHVELESLADDFVFRELAQKLRLIVPPCTVISNREWTVRAKPVDFAKIRTHLSRVFVKVPSDQLQELIIGRRVRHGGTTTAFLGEEGTMGPPTGTNRVVSAIEFAACAVWDCAARRAIEVKARDIRSRLADAVEQLPREHPSVVHVGLETLDGWMVEKERFARICQTVSRFDAKGKMLYWVYCHLFQPYSPPEKDWEFDETVHFFKHEDYAGPAPLREESMILPYECMRPATSPA